MDNLSEQMKKLLKNASYGLSESDIKNTMDFINHGEFGIAFELVCDQLFENEAPISTELLNEIQYIGTTMNFDEQTWAFLKNAK